jgi:lauroyl/myristoyl acyltransferase
VPETLSKLGYKIGVVVNRYQNNMHYLGRCLDKLLHNFRSRNDVKVFYKDDVFSIVRFVKAGGVLGMLVDGNTFYKKFKNAHKLSRLCRVPLVPFAAYRHNGKGILELDCNLEKLVRIRPLDYVWFYKSRTAA